MEVIKQFFFTLIVCELSSVVVLGKPKLQIVGVSPHFSKDIRRPTSEYILARWSRVGTQAAFLKICSKSNPKLKQCLIDSVENLRPLMAKGIPEFGIPSCEPLIIPEVIIDQGQGPVSVKSSYRGIEVFGPMDFFIKNIKIDLDKDRVKIKLYIPELRVNANYSMDGQILLMPITGTGLSFGNYTNIESTMTMKAKRIEKDGETYYNIQDCYIDFNIGNAELQFDNLFNGNKELGEAMNLFLNDNWKSVTNEIKPVLEDKIAEIFKKFANKIFHKYPISMLFPE